jgi:acyl CoA:acetate/3-ketoacid CoA transferase beta subunit
LGENADNGKYPREKSNLIQIHDTAAKSYKATLIANEHYLFRVLLGNGVQAAILGLKIVDPNGDEAAS